MLQVIQKMIVNLKKITWNYNPFERHSYSYPIQKYYIIKIIIIDKLIF